MKDPYRVLGVSRSASAEEIKQAYRRLAKEHHPDLRPGDRKQTERFKEVSAAYDVLRDSERRAKFDQDEQVKRAGGFHPWGKTARAEAGGQGFSGADEIFSELFGGRSGRRRASKGAEVRASVSLDFLSAVKGDKKNVDLPGGRRIEVRIPPGTRDGQVLRLRGQGEPGADGGEPGDALIEIRVEPHPIFRREGADIHVDLPISLGEAVHGAKVTVETVDGSVVLTIPAGTGGARPLRLKGRGAPDGQGGRGDQYIHPRIVLPERIDPDLHAFVRRWTAEHPYDPRRSAGR